MDSRFDQLQLQIDSMRQQLAQINGALANEWPKVIGSGVLNFTGNATFNVVDLSAGWTSPVGSNKLFSPTDGDGTPLYDLTDGRYTIQLTPEGGHEAWSVSRFIDSVSFYIFNRSGTTRVGYGGLTSFMIVENSQPTV